MHPAALRLIAHTITLAQFFGKECSLCGEMAGDKLGFAALALLGLRKFSVSPSKLLQNKAALAKLDLTALAPVGKQLLACTSAEETIQLLRQSLPEDYFG